MRLQNAFENSVMESSSLVSTETLSLKHVVRHQGRHGEMCSEWPGIVTRHVVGAKFAKSRDASLRCDVRLQPTIRAHAQGGALSKGAF